MPRATQLAVATVATSADVRRVAGKLHTRGRSGPSSQGRVAAEHGHAGAVLGAAEGDHVLADVRGYKISVMGAAIRQDVLDQVVAKLITSNINQRHTGTVGAALAYALEVAVEELAATNLEALLNHLGSILIHAVFGSKAEDVVDGSVAVRSGPVLADVLDAPIAELAVRDDINACKDFIDAGPLTVQSVNVLQ